MSTMESEGFHKSLGALRELLLNQSDKKSNNTTTGATDPPVTAENDQLDHLHSEIASLRRKLRQEQDERQDVERKVDSLEEQLTEERTRIKGLEVSHRTLAKEKEERQAKSTIFQSVKRAMQEKIDALEASLGKEQKLANKRASKLQKQLQKVQLKYEEVNKQCGLLEAQRISALRQSEDAIVQKQKLEDEVTVARKEAGVAQKRLSETMEKLESVQGQLKNYKANPPASENDKAPRADKARNVVPDKDVDDVAAIKSKLQSTEKLLQAKSTMVERLQNNSAGHSKEIAKLKAELSSAKDELDRVKQEKIAEQRKAEAASAAALEAQSPKPTGKVEAKASASPTKKDPGTKTTGQKRKANPKSNVEKGSPARKKQTAAAVRRSRRGGRAKQDSKQESA